ncbi:MAG: MarC family protein [Rivihabitans pingtungensis]|mgnify:FL=1|jgi:multiple antibiotic resistance protein|uniref:MarC family protein n=1 Tax=Rivihabitans pingtungensis TaxID=1054498 RepID=UPI002356898E|nr:MarC family protein [Rivihabitans pingtungensis]MCK6437323.1 NAAT family transporter [Rivihabitans pingtungensis]HNX70051.1 MarC family protein [Rivihabitans pingtungensis]
MDAVKIFIALLVLVNPIGAIPIFIGLTPDASAQERKRIAKTASIAVAVIILTFVALGDSLIRLLGISMGSFQVGGGILVMMISLSMMNAAPTATKTTRQETEEAGGRANIAVVPLALPLLTGPGTISTVIIYSGHAHGWWAYLSLVICALLIALACYVAMIAATPVSRMLGQTGINIVNRVMGMLLAALSVEIIADGAVKLFPALGH